MRIPLAAVMIAVVSMPTIAQAPASREKPGPGVTAGTKSVISPDGVTPKASAEAWVEDSELGFSSRLPADWRPIAAASNKLPYPTAILPKKGDACVSVALTAHHRSSDSVIVVLTLPFACYGQTMTGDDLANFGSGAAAGMKLTFNIANQAETTYSLGRHSFWIERADGTPKHRPESPYTFEIACTVLEKGAACWMTMAADAASLHDFEQQNVTLDGDAFDVLVPPSAAPSVPEIVTKNPS